MKKIVEEASFERFRRKYREAGKAEKGTMLTNYCELTGCHRKHAVRLLRRREAGRPSNPGKRGRKSSYDCPEVVQGLKLAYRATDRMCSALLKGAIPEWLPAIEVRYGALSAECRQKLLRISARTIERLLHAYKIKFPKPKTGTKPGTIKRTEIEVRQGIWDEKNPGFMESDTVAHGGNSMSGQFAWSLTMTDIATHWTELRAVWHKAAQGVVAAVKEIETALPFDLLGFDCDNGGEFINQYLIRYFTVDHPRKNILKFTRSREYHKNDNAHVEQRNWSHPRQLFFRERLDFYELIELMNDIYRNEFSLLRNHFYPTFKLDARIMILSRYRRIYGDPKTPYQRILESQSVPEDKKEDLRRIHAQLNPLQLKDQLDAKLRKFWALVRRLRSQNAPEVVSFAEATSNFCKTIG